MQIEVVRRTWFSAYFDIMSQMKGKQHKWQNNEQAHECNAEIFDELGQAQ